MQTEHKANRMALLENSPFCKSSIVYLMVCMSVAQYLTCLADEGRIIVFKEPVWNKVLTDHVIRREEVPNEGSCRVKCYMEPNCVSINMGPLKGRKLKCELNDATGENEFSFDLRTENDHTYVAIENPCSSSPCLNNSTCQAGFTSKGFRCKCAPGFSGENCGAVAKSCSDLKKNDPRAESGNYVIDPDGEGGLLPMYDVICDMTDKNGVGVTVISHDSENRTLVKGYDGPGSYSRDIHYSGANLSQLASLTKVSIHCEQFIKYECYHSRLLRGNFGWWVSRDSQEMLCWGGASESGKCCACRISGTCAKSRYGCNCDANDDVWREDSGLLTDKEKLPVKQLRFGDTGDRTEKGYHTLGKLKCYGTASP